MILKLSDVMENCIKNIDSLMNNKCYSLKGIFYGFNKLDLFTDGLQKGHLVVVIARPSMGKTAFVSAISQNLSVKQNIPTAFFSLGQDIGRFAKRICSSMTGIDMHKISSGFLSNQEHDQVENIRTQIATTPLYVADSFFELKEIEEKIKVLKNENGVKVVIIDSLDKIDLIRLLPSEVRRERRIENCRLLKEMAVSLGIPILITTSCYSSKYQSKGNELYDFVGDKGDVARYADEVLVLNREEYDNPTDSNRGLAEVAVFTHKINHLATIPFYFFKNWAMDIEER